MTLNPKFLKLERIERIQSCGKQSELDNFRKFYPHEDYKNLFRGQFFLLDYLETSPCEF